MHDPGVGIGRRRRSHARRCHGERHDQVRIEQARSGGAVGEGIAAHFAKIVDDDDQAVAEALEVATALDAKLKRIRPDRAGARARADGVRWRRDGGEERRFEVEVARPALGHVEDAGDAAGALGQGAPGADDDTEHHGEREAGRSSAARHGGHERHTARVARGPRVGHLLAPSAQPVVSLLAIWPSR